MQPHAGICSAWQAVAGRGARRPRSASAAPARASPSDGGRAPRLNSRRGLKWPQDHLWMWSYIFQGPSSSTFMSVAETAALLPIGCGAVLSVLRGNRGPMTPDDRATSWLLAHQHGVISRAQVLASGITAEGLRHRVRRGGPWQRLLPGIYLTVTGEADARAASDCRHAVRGADQRHHGASGVTELRDPWPGDRDRRRANSGSAAASKSPVRGDPPNYPAAAAVDVRGAAAVCARCPGGRGRRQGAGSAGSCTSGRRQRCAEEPLHHLPACRRTGSWANPGIGSAAGCAGRGC